MPRKRNFEKEKVLEKAIDLFWKQGFHATSMDTLVTTLGINRASMYNVFGSKQQLLEEALEEYKNKEISRISNFLQNQLSVRQGLYLLFESEVERSINNNSPKGCFLVNTITELSVSNEQLSATLKAYQGEYELVFFDYLKYGVEEGQISSYKDLKSISISLFNLKAGLSVISKLKNEKEDLLKLFEISLKVLD